MFIHCLCWQQYFHNQQILVVKKYTKIIVIKVDFYKDYYCWFLPKCLAVGKERYC